MWKSVIKTKPPIKQWIKVKRSVSRGTIEYQSIGLVTSNTIIVKSAKGVNGKSVTHWDYL